jgi:putative acyl-CoA dehydrogenase
MAIEVEAATLMAFRAAKATDQARTSEHERHLSTVLTPVAMFFNCCRSSALTYEALQLQKTLSQEPSSSIGRLHREATHNSAIYGTFNTLCTDVRRVLNKDNRVIESLFTEYMPLANQDPRFAALFHHVDQMVWAAVDDDFYARRMVAAVARLVQAAELLRHSAPEISSAFLNVREPNALGAWGQHCGTAAAQLADSDLRQIVQRAQTNHQSNLGGSARCDCAVSSS